MTGKTASYFSSAQKRAVVESIPPEKRTTQDFIVSPF
jgi:hypothetical protein